MQNGIIIKGIHWQYNTTITHEGCRDMVLDADDGNIIGVIENYDVV